MAYNFNFKDNDTYGAEDINNITKRLVTSGVSDVFENGTPYNLLALNDIGALLYTSGAVPETVNSLKVTRLSEDKLLINPGMAFFADGAVFEVLAGGEEIACLTGVKQYVYLKNDLVDSNVCYPACTESAPTGDCVLLAEILENGEIKDTRTYAKGKLPGYSSNADYMLEITDTIKPPGGDFTEQKTYDIGNNKYRFLVLYQEGYTTADLDKLNYVLGIYNFETGKLFSADCKSSRLGYVYADTYNFTIYRNLEDYAEAKITVSDGKLTLDISGRTQYNAPFSYTMYLL